MMKTVRCAFKFGITVALALVMGTGAVFALNQSDSGIAANSVMILKSQGVTCGSCAGKIENALKEKAGVASVEVDLDSGQVIVAFDSKVAKPETLAETVTGLGYRSSILQNLTVEQYRATTGKSVSIRTAKSGACGSDCCNKKRN